MEQTVLQNDDKLTPSGTLRQNLDSSVNNTRLQSCIFQFWCSIAKLSRASRCRCFKAGVICQFLSADTIIYWYILDDQIQVSDYNHQFPRTCCTLAVQFYEKHLKICNITLTPSIINQRYNLCHCCRI